MFFKNLALIGPPGSGKGSYGRHLAKALNITLLTMSDVLRKQMPDLTLGDGKLIDDEVVSQALLHSLQDTQQQRHQTGYLLDGFPRTMDQIRVMQETFPEKLQVQAVLQLNVPDRVCKTKLLGRRFCRLCETNFSVNGVDFDDFYLPPSQPQHCHHPCHPDKDWIIRDDDTEEVVQERLKVYHQHMDPISKHFEEKNALLKLTPYNGYDDIPFILSTVEKWLQERLKIDEHLGHESETH
jgi:adenylate kinase